jgi:hypothetical protein
MNEELAEQPVYGIIDPDYARVYTIIRCTVWGYGYAAMMHGSFTRDLDILIVPWSEHAQVSHDHLVDVICGRAGLRKNGNPPGEKPHGRIAYTLLFKEFGDPRFVDISFTPNTNWPKVISDD